MAAHRAIGYAALGMVAGLMAAQTAEASLVVYEGFQYNTGTTGSADTGGMGWTGAWSAGGTITSPGLEATPQAANDNSVALGAISPNYDDIERSISTGSMTTLNANGTYYISYLFNLQYSDRNASFDLALLDGSTDVLAVGVLPTNNSNGDFNLYNYSTTSNSTISPYTSAPPSTATASSPNIANKTTYLLVVAIDTATDTASLYVDPGSAQPAQAHATISVSPTNLSGINNVELFAGYSQNANSALEFDEIKMGTTFADVAAPEPATLGLLALSAAGLMLRRRRRRGDASTILMNTPAEPLSI